MDATARHDLENHGYCVIRDVLTARRSAEILDEVWHSIEVNKQLGLATHLNRDPNEQNVRATMLIDRGQTFEDLVTHDIALDVVETLLGPDYILSNLTGNIARPGSGSMLVHSDQSLVAPAPWTEAWAVNVIWCLTDVHQDNGATLYLPESHKYRTADELPEDTYSQLRPFEAPVGSVIVMDGRTWHTSGFNVTADEDRALLFAFYCRSFVRPQMNWPAILDPDVFDAMPSEIQRLLGGNPARAYGTQTTARFGPRPAQYT